MLCTGARPAGSADCSGWAAWPPRHPPRVLRARQVRRGESTIVAENPPVRDRFVMRPRMDRAAFQTGARASPGDATQHSWPPATLRRAGADRRSATRLVRRLRPTRHDDRIHRRRHLARAARAVNAGGDHPGRLRWPTRTPAVHGRSLACYSNRRISRRAPNPSHRQAWLPVLFPRLTCISAAHMARRYKDAVFRKTENDAAVIRPHHIPSCS